MLVCFCQLLWSDINFFCVLIFISDFLVWNYQRIINGKQVFDNDRLKDEEIEEDMCRRSRICDHLVLAVTEHSSLKMLSWYNFEISIFELFVSPF